MHKTMTIYLIYSGIGKWKLPFYKNRLNMYDLSSFTANTQFASANEYAVNNNKFEINANTQL